MPKKRLREILEKCFGYLVNKEDIDLAIQEIIALRLKELDYKLQFIFPILKRLADNCYKEGKGKLDTTEVIEVEKAEKAITDILKTFEGKD